MMLEGLEGVRYRVWSPGCKKWRYPDEQQAWDQLELHKERRKAHPPKMRKRPLPQNVYRCPRCPGYHITHEEPGKKPNRTKRKKIKMTKRGEF